MSALGLVLRRERRLRDGDSDGDSDDGDGDDALGVIADIEAGYENLLGKTRFATRKSILGDLLPHTDRSGSLGADDHTGRAAALLPRTPATR